MVQPFSSSKFFLIAGLIGVIGSVPIDTKKRGGELYDQRQTGEYNIRVNLKDIQIIAILGGDYNDDNYEYDYEIPSDYTDFPISTTTTSTSTLNSTNLNSSNTSTSTVTIQPKPVTTTNSPKTTKTKSTNSTLNSSTTKPSTSTKSSTSNKVTSTNKPPLTTSKPSTGIAASSTTLKPLNKTLTYSYQTGLTGDRIPVIVLQQNQNNDVLSKAAGTLITSQVTIVPDNGGNENEEITERVESLGEIHYKKCPNGLVRDKNGICRKLKRPPLFDISRFTSSLVSKFRRQDAVTPGSKTTN